MLPDTITTESQLDDLLSDPTPAVVETMSRLKGDLLILGVGGKMGPTLARMARRASDMAGVRRRIVGVSRFSQPDLPEQLNRWNIDTLSADLLDPAQLASLPDAPNILYMAAMKFGATGQEARTWAMNTLLPGLVAQRFKASRIVAFSTGNVYGLSPVSLGGSVETDALDPLGDYAMSCVGRERIFEHFSRTHGTPMSIVRLNYAIDLRYGVLHDLATRIHAGQPIDLSMGNVNVIWQADANAHTLQSFDHAATPPFVVNVTGPELLSIRRLAEQLGSLLGKIPTFVNTESSSALLNNAQKSHRLFGHPRVSITQLLQWTADWVKQGGRALNKPTHFQTRDGKF
jgi:nucleoside-diphosphate-sugar epimerase